MAPSSHSQDRRCNLPTIKPSHSMIKGFLNIPYFVWTVGALIVAGLFISIWPHKVATETAGFRYFVIRWRHALAWLLLAVSFSRSVRGIGLELNGGASFLGLSGSFIYLLSILMTFIVK